MISAPTFVAFVACALAAGMSLKRGMAFPVYAFLVALTFFNLCGWWMLQKFLPNERGYLYFFSSFVLVLVFALWLAFYWLDDFWVGIPFFVSVSASAVTAALLIYFAILQRGKPNHPSGQLNMTLVISASLLVCGCVSLLTLRREVPSEESYAALAIGLFCVLQGAWGYAFAGSLGRWKVANLVVGPMLGVALFGWLFVRLSGAQPESARQHIRDESSLTELEHLEAM